MHQPYTAPTLNSTRPATGLHTSPRQSSIHKPIHQRHSPHIPHSTNTTLHKYHNHTASTNTYSLHTHTASTKTHAHSTQARPPTQTLTLTPLHREAMPCPDVDAQPASSGLTVRPSGRTRSRRVSNWTGHIRLDRPGRIRPNQVRHQTCRVQYQDQAISSKP